MHHCFAGLASRENCCDLVWWCIYRTVYSTAGIWTSCGRNILKQDYGPTATRNIIGGHHTKRKEPMQVINTYHPKSLLEKAWNLIDLVSAQTLRHLKQLQTPPKLVLAAVADSNTHHRMSVSAWIYWWKHMCTHTWHTGSELLVPFTTLARTKPPKKGFFSRRL